MQQMNISSNSLYNFSFPVTRLKKLYKYIQNFSTIFQVNYNVAISVK